MVRSRSVADEARPEARPLGEVLRVIIVEPIVPEPETDDRS